MPELTEWEGLIRVTIAAVLGGIIGIERELRAKEAGLRTNMLVAMGAALFTISSIQLSEFYLDWNGSIRYDPSRIISTIVSGVGFLGGAVIFKTEQRVRGVTTAASIWVVTGVGVAVGAGFYLTAIGSTVLIVIVLLIVGWVEHLVGFKGGPILPKVEDD